MAGRRELDLGEPPRSLSGRVRPGWIAFATAQDGTAWAATGRNGAACAPPLGLIYQHGPRQSSWQQLPPWKQDQIDSLIAISQTVAYAVSGQGVLLTEQKS